MALNLTDDEIARIAARHCEFSGEGNYHLRRYSGASAIVTVVRECFDLAELCRQAEAAPSGVAVDRHQTKCEQTPMPSPMDSESEG